MIEEHVISAIRRAWRDCMPLLSQGPAARPVNGEQSWICPLCGHGKGGDGMAEVPNSGGILKCFGCRWSGDVIALYRQINPGTPFEVAIENLAGQAGVYLERGSTGSHAQPARMSAPAQLSAPAPGSAERIEVLPDATSPAAPSAGSGMPRADMRDAYFAECSAALRGLEGDAAHPAISYLQGRGIELRTALACGTGFDPAADPVAAPFGRGRAAHPTPRLIFPAGDSYIGRALQAEGDYIKLNAKGFAIGLSGLQSIREDEPFFICEGAFDRMALVQAGAGAVVALNSASNVQLLIGAIPGMPEGAKAILALDHDEAGCRARDKLRSALQGAGIAVCELEYAAAAKDPGEALEQSAAGLKDAIAAAVSAANKISARNTLASYLQGEYQAECDSMRGTLWTGLQCLDEPGGGGLHAGLYVMSGLPGSGKTTFMLQAAYMMLRRNPDASCVFFSCEMPRRILTAKLITHICSRPPETYDAMSIWYPTTAADSPRVWAARAQREYSDAYIADGIDELCTAIGERMEIIETDFELTPGRIMQTVKPLARKGPLVVIVDYLQIMHADPPADGLKPGDRRERIDTVITGLKQISRGLNCTVLAVSSLNRAAYHNGPALEGLKESGTIEYTADAICSLGAPDAPDMNYGTYMAMHPRPIVCTVLKNRFGPLSKHLLWFYPEVDAFMQDDLQSCKEMHEGVKGRSGAGAAVSVDKAIRPRASRRAKVN